MIILASASNSRKKLWDYLDQPVVVVSSGTREEVEGELDPDELVCELAVKKARFVYEKAINSMELMDDEGVRYELDEGFWVVAGDTMVEKDGKMIGKPKDEREAREIISHLAGTTHKVWSGVCVINADGEMAVDFACTQLTLAPMTSKQIDLYIKTDEWRGRAGGYEILKSIRPYVTDIRGGVTTVIGLPIKLTLGLLNQTGCDLEIDSEKKLAARIGFLD